MSIRTRLCLETLEDRINPAPTAAGFVERLYEDLLQRAPDAYAGHWVVALESGEMSHRDVVNQILRSDEHLSLVIGGMYQQILHRAPDGKGLSGFVDAVQDGKDLEDVALEMVVSPEYRGKAPGGEAFLNSIFLDVLGRAPDEIDRQNFAPMFGDATIEEADDIAQLVVKSHEARGLSVDDAYATLLDRSADDLSRIGFIGAIQTEGDILDVDAELASSEEYFALIG